MRSTRVFRIGATACATALMAGAGALATAGSASAAISAPAAAGISTQSAALTQIHALNLCYLIPAVPGSPVSVPVVICQNTGLLGGIIDGLLG
jgi:hypothetical protein